MKENALVPADFWLLPAAVEPTLPDGYASPRVDHVLTPEMIEANIKYAGAYTPGPWTDIPD